MSKTCSSCSRGGIGWRLVSTRTACSIVLDADTGSSFIWLISAVSSGGLGDLAATTGGEPPRCKAHKEDEEDQHERSRPGARVVGRVGRVRELEDRHGNGLRAAVSGFQLDPASPTSEDVNSSGAVSPATRATASVAPVSDAADRLRQHDAERRPPARRCRRPVPPLAASSGTSASTSIVERATSGSMSTASAKARRHSRSGRARPRAARRRRSRSRSPGRRARTSSVRVTTLRMALGANSFR